MKKLMLVLMVCFLCVGCVSTSLTLPTGEKIRYDRFMYQSIDTLDIVVDPNTGLITVHMEGQKSENQKLAEILIGGIGYVAGVQK